MQNHQTTRPLPQRRINPVNQNPETIHPKRRRRPPKSTVPSDADDEVEITNIQLNTNKTQSYWKQQSAKEIRNQLQLRKIPSTSAWMTKKGLLEIVKKLVQENKW